MTYLHYISVPFPISIFFFFFNDTATTEIYTLSLHDALPIYNPSTSGVSSFTLNGGSASIAYNAKSWLSGVADFGGDRKSTRLNSSHLVISYAVFCLKKKKKNIKDMIVLTMENTVHL